MSLRVHFLLRDPMHGCTSVRASHLHAMDRSLLVGGLFSPMARGRWTKVRFGMEWMDHLRVSDEDLSFRSSR